MDYRLIEALIGPDDTRVHEGDLITLIKLLDNTLVLIQLGVLKLMLW